MAVVGGHHDQGVLLGGHLAGPLHGIVKLEGLGEGAASLGVVVRMVDPAALHLHGMRWVQRSDDERAVC